MGKKSNESTNWMHNPKIIEQKFLIRKMAEDNLTWEATFIMNMGDPGTSP